VNLEIPEVRYARSGDFCRRLADFPRLILFDKRGTGLCDRPRDLPSFETRMGDVRAVMDDVGSERAALLGAGSPGGQLCALFAATYPERIVALMLHNTWPRVVSAPRLSDRENPGGMAPAFTGDAAELGSA
jgi:pimeloyl-ACP methyl ester carboxylesterase